MINEHNIKNSFRVVKADILTIQGEFLEIKQQQAKILLQLEKLTSKPKKKKIKKKAKKKIVKKK